MLKKKQKQKNTTWHGELAAWRSVLRQFIQRINNDKNTNKHRYGG